MTFILSSTVFLNSQNSIIECSNIKANIFFDITQRLDTNIEANSLEALLALSVDSKQNLIEFNPGFASFATQDTMESIDTLAIELFFRKIKSNGFAMVEGKSPPGNINHKDYINKLFLNPDTMVNNYRHKYYIEIQSPINGWDALQMVAYMNLPFDNPFYKCEKCYIFIPVYFGAILHAEQVGIYKNVLFSYEVTNDNGVLKYQFINQVDLIYFSCD